MDHAYDRAGKREIRSAFDSTTFDRDGEVKVNEDVGAASISPSGRDVVLAGRDGLLVIDLDHLYSSPRRFSHHSRWDVADVQWSPFPERAYWVVSTSNQKALVWNLESYSSRSPIEHVLHAHTRAITDINFSGHDPDLLATCAVDSFVHCWDLRFPARPALTFADWNAGATQVKWNRQDQHIIASSHHKYLKIWDKRKGAVPLRTIEAHSTKIYGIDWNRTTLTGIATCSLDRTIKFWDYSQEHDEPERVIQTSYPVWRARHTPFGWGMLAMPQRGDYDLHLYDRRMSEDTPKDGLVAPVRSYSGHLDNVYEFLWRSRGEVEQGMDNRDFQLVSWGADKYLRLHRVKPEDLKAVGHEKGQMASHGLHLIRLGALYQSYRDEDTETPFRLASDLPSFKTFKPQGLGALISQAGLSRVSTTMSLPTASQGFLTSFKATAKPVKKNLSPMKWIEGVRIGSRPVDDHMPLEGKEAGETPEGLSDEMMYVSKRYKKVTFEHADVHGRRATVTLHGPWGKEGKNVFLRVNFDFPVTYPFLSRPEVHFERTHSGIPDDAIQTLNNEVITIMEHYRSRRRGSLEAVITYLLGEKGLEESMLVKPHDGLEVPFTSPADEDSSDEEGGVAPDMEASGTVLPAQTNIPVPRTCGAVWTGDSQLVCFFLPKPEAVPTFSVTALRITDRAKNHPRRFEVFGRLKQESIGLKDRNAPSDDGLEDDSSGSVTDTSSSSSSDESEDVSNLPARFNPPLAWRAAMLRNAHKPSSHSSSGVLKKIQPLKNKSFLSITDFSHLLPSKKSLASEYLIFGDGPTICQHNAKVATKYGLATLSAVWQLCEIILYNEVPLEILDQQVRKDPILIMAKRNLVRINRKDSGLDLGFDDPESVRDPKLKGRVKWGNHPLAGTLLIPRLFEHFERQGDIQMLAMLSCIFSEPAAKEGTQYSLLNFRPEDMPIALKAPAFSLDYFPTRSVAWSQYQDKKFGARLPNTPLDTVTGDYFSRPPTTFGSLSSSNGPWAGDGTAPVDPITPYSTGNTPPVPLSRQTTVGSSLSTSPEPGANRSFRRSQSSFSHAFNHLTKTLSGAGSSSPPVIERPRIEPEVSSSAPTAGFLWGGNTASFTGTGSSSPNSPVLRRKNKTRAASFVTQDGAYNSSGSDTDEISEDDDDDEVVVIHSKAPDRSHTIHVTLKNQHLFDQEGHASVPLLNPMDGPKHMLYRQAYANLLSQWSLHTAQAEVLKFNGLTPYYSLDRISSEILPSWASIKSTVFDSSKNSVQFALTPTPEYIPSQNGSGSSTPNRPLNPNAPEFVPQPQLLHQDLTASLKSLHSQTENPSSKSSLLNVPINAVHHSATHHTVRLSDVNAHQREFRPLHSATSMARTASNSTIVKSTGRTKDSVEKLPIEERICVACWEVVQGLHVICITGKHRAHRECILEREELEWGNLRGLGVGCVCEGGVE